MYLLFIPHQYCSKLSTKMRDEESQMTPNTATLIAKKNTSGFEGLFGKGKYKLWLLAAIILLALWSMFTGTVTLKWSGGHLAHSLHASTPRDLDILDVDEREKMVRQMWDAYKHSSIARLPSFWRDAFGAAYQDLTSEIASVRNAALLEIARMSFGSRNVYDSPPSESTVR